MGRKAFWRITLPVLRAMPSCIRSITGHEKGVDFVKRHFFHKTAIDHAEISGKKPGIAGVAQLVEHPICNRAVGSSSLSASTTLLHENVDFTVLL